MLRNYLREIEKTYQTGDATEHTYRFALQKLLETLFPGVSATNEPKRIQSTWLLSVKRVEGRCIHKWKAFVRCCFLTSLMNSSPICMLNRSAMVFLLLDVTP